MMNSIIRLDTRGRLVIPNEFRETLDLKEGDEVLMSLDTKTNTLIISPIYGKADNQEKIEIEFDDKPGSLAKLAETLAKINIDLVMTESKSFQRGAKARWYIIADMTKCPYGINEIKKTLLQNHSVESVSVTKIARDRLHR
jgi:AbrB family looped-hinge helix DNA binding protein